MFFNMSVKKKECDSFFFQLIVYLCKVFLRRYLQVKVDGWETQTCEKAFISALFLAFQNFANSRIKSTNMAMVDVPGYVIYPSLYPYITVRILVGI